MAEYNENMCRVCLQSFKSDFASIFENATDKTKLSELGLLYEELFNLSIHVDEPQYICSYCNLQLKFFHKFKTKAVESYAIFFGYKSTEKDSFTILELPDDINDENYKYLDIPDAVVHQVAPPAGSSTPPAGSSAPPLCTSSAIDSDPMIKTEQEVSYEIVAKEEYEVQEFCTDVIYSDSSALNQVHDMKKDEDKDNAPTKKFPCKSCDKVFDTIWFLRRHRKAIHESMRIPCSMCPKKCMSAENLREHIIVEHQGLQGFQCELCKRILKYKRNYEFHMKKHRNDIRFYRFRCSMCDKRFQSNAALDRHFRVHSQPTGSSAKPVCTSSALDSDSPMKMKMEQDLSSKMVGKEKHEVQEFCTDVINTNSSVLNRVHDTKVKTRCRLKNGEEPTKKFPCKSCDKVFDKIWHLNTHRKTTHDIKMRRCSKCPKKFISDESLREHIIVVHQGLPAYRCDLCKMMLKNKRNYECHMKRHRVEKRLRCSMCDRHFKSNAALERHFRVHTGESPCDKCTI